LSKSQAHIVFSISFSLVLSESQNCYADSDSDDQDREYDLLETNELFIAEQQSAEQGEQKTSGHEADAHFV